VCALRQPLDHAKQCCVWSQQELIQSVRTEWMASASIAELPESPATTNLVTAMAQFPPNAARTVTLLDREVMRASHAHRSLVLHSDITLDGSHALRVASDLDRFVGGFLRFCRAAQPDYPILVRVDSQVAHGGKVFSSQFCFDFRRNRRVLRRSPP
jgi:hypothetical protein